MAALKLVSVTRRTRGAEEMIASALDRGRHVMARARNGVWFPVSSFRSAPVDPEHPDWGKMWWATRSGSSGRGSQVRTLNWFERPEGASPQSN